MVWNRISSWLSGKGGNQGRGLRNPKPKNARELIQMFQSPRDTPKEQFIDLIGLSLLGLAVAEQEDLEKGYFEGLLEKAGLVNLPPDFRVEYLKVVKKQLASRLGIVLLENQDEEQFERIEDEVGEMERPEDFAKLMQCLLSNVQDLDKLISEALLGFEADFIQATKK